MRDVGAYVLAVNFRQLAPVVVIAAVLSILLVVFATNNGAKTQTPIIIVKPAGTGNGNVLVNGVSSWESAFADVNVAAAELSVLAATPPAQNEAAKQTRKRKLKELLQREANAVNAALQLLGSDDEADKHNGHTHDTADTAAHTHITLHNHTHEINMQEKQSEADRNKAECILFINNYDVIPGKSWGTLPDNLKIKYDLIHCNLLLSHEEFIQKLIENPELLEPVIIPTNRTPSIPDTEYPVISICIGSTTRNIKNLNTLNDLVLFNALLPSLVTYAEAEYEYWVHLVYDQGDPFLDQESSKKAIEQWFSDNVQKILLSKQPKPIHSRLFLVPFHNKIHKPGPAFNYITAIAYFDGADYIYRINDDSIFQTFFANEFINQLKSFNPSNVGVVGPVCREGNTGILTHDFTHRIHHEIFGYLHYPPQLTDWWMDDWITRVYGRKRTVRVKNVVVKHSVTSHGTRYPVDHSHAALLEGLLEDGRLAIEGYLDKNKHTDALADYRHDEFSFRLPPP